VHGGRGERNYNKKKKNQNTPSTYRAVARDWDSIQGGEERRQPSPI